MVKKLKDLASKNMNISSFNLVKRTNIFLNKVNDDPMMVWLSRTNSKMGSQLY